MSDEVIIIVGMSNPACVGVRFSLSASSGRSGIRKLEYESSTQCAAESSVTVNLS